MRERPASPRWLLFAVAASALVIRLVGLDFDQNHFFHPDERAIGDAILRLSFHPLQLNPHFFAYGSLPFYLTKAVSSLLAEVSGRDWFSSYDGIVHVGRFLSALAGALTVLLVAAVGRRLYGEKAGLLAGLLLALAVLHVQTSHFASTDVTLTLFVLLALAASGRLASRGRGRDALLAGALTGFALATKASAAPLLLPLAVAVFLACRPARAWRRGALLLTWAGLAAFVAFFLGEPYAFLDFPEFWRSVSEQGAMVRHAGLMPYTNQYIGVPNFLYEAREIVLWGLGPFFGLAALWAAGRRLARFRTLSSAEWVLASFFVPYVLLTCTFEVKFPRYLLPVYPLLALWAAAWLTEKAEHGRAGRLLRAVVVGGTAVWALAFASIYTRRTARHGVVVVSRPRPGGRAGPRAGLGRGVPVQLSRPPGRALQGRRVRFYENDSPEKMSKLARELAEADWVVLQTKRLYGAVTRAPEKFPLTNRAFRLLFAGDLGYTLVHEVASRPSLLGIQVPDELADESFTVYDHPKVLFFQNTGRRSAEAIEKALLSATPSKTFTRDDLLLAHPAASAATSTAGAAEPGRGVPGLRSSFLALLLFAAWLELTGLAARGFSQFFFRPARGETPSGVSPASSSSRSSPGSSSRGVRAFTRGLLVVTTAALFAAGFLCRRRAGRPRQGQSAGRRRSSSGARSLLPRRARPEPGDLLGRKADGLLVPQHAPEVDGASAARTLARRHAALVHVFRPFPRRGGGEAPRHPSRHPVQPRDRDDRGAFGLAILAGGAALGGRLRTGAVAVLLAPSSRLPPGRAPRSTSISIRPAARSTGTTSGRRRASSRRTRSTSTPSGASSSRTCTLTSSRSPSRLLSLRRSSSS